jgi:membrane associated rhomboid family serine protease
MGLADRDYMRETYRPPMPVWLVLIIACVSVFAVQLITRLAVGSPNFFTEYLTLRPMDLARGHVWQLLTFQFLHGDLMHVALNCLMLWMFGRTVEEALGRSRFLQLYLIAGATGGLLQAACAWLVPGHFPPRIGVVGASAGVFGLIATFAALHWETRITMLVYFIIPINMKAKWLLVIFVVLAVLGMLTPESPTAHAAHLGGLLFGLAFVRLGWHHDFRTPPWESVWGRMRASMRQSTPRSRPVRRQPTRILRVPPSELLDEENPDFISKEVDPILDKISQHGIHSLTERERRILEKARERMAKR